LVANGSLREAEFHYQEAIRNNPDFWFGYYGLGQMYFRSHRSAQAVPLLEQAATLTTYEPGPSYYLGLAQMDLGHLDEASIALQKAIRLYPTGPGYQVALEQIRARQCEKNYLPGFRGELVRRADNSAQSRVLVPNAEKTKGQ
jgi:tetratricopeptide (TPR) repeat protein